MLSTLWQLFAHLFFSILHVIPSSSFPRPLSTAREKELLERCAKGDQEARQQLIEHNLRLVAHIVKKYYAVHSDPDDLISIGTIGLIASDRVKQVIGIELNEDAVRDAMKNARANNVSNVEFYCDDAGDFMREMAANGEKVDVVFMDPPRSGSDEIFLSSVVQLAPKRVVYISCNPETMARDLEYLTDHGYRAITAWPFDMFPSTAHIEVVTCLSR